MVLSSSSSLRVFRNPRPLDLTTTPHRLTKNFVLLLLDPSRRDGGAGRESMFMLVVLFVLLSTTCFQYMGSPVFCHLFITFLSDLFFVALFFFPPPVRSLVTTPVKILDFFFFPASQGGRGLLRAKLDLIANV